MSTKVARVGTAAVTALSLFFTGMHGFIEIENLFKKRENKAQVTFINEVVAAERRLEQTVDVEINGKSYSIEKDNVGKFLVSDSSGQPVQDEDIAQKAIFSQLVYDGYMKKGRLSEGFLYKTAFKTGELMQYAKNTFGLIFFGHYKLLAAGVKGGKVGGPKGALLGSLGELTKEAIIGIGKKVVNHPEGISRGIAIEAYKEGYNNWKNNISIADNVRRSGILKYEDAERLLYQWFHASLLMNAADRLTDDIGNFKYDASIDATVANTTFALLGRNLDSLKKEGIIDEVSRTLNQSLGQYPPLKGFTENFREIIVAYIKKKVELDERALGLIGEKPVVEVEQKRYANGLIAFQFYTGADYEILTANPVTKELKYLIKHPADDTQPSWSFNGESFVFLSDRHKMGWFKEVYIAYKDGSNVRRVTHGKFGGKQGPKFLPNGEIVYFTSVKPGEPYRLFVTKSDGSGTRRLTNDNCWESYPSVSLWNNRLSYICKNDDRKVIKVLDIRRNTVLSEIDVSDLYSPMPEISPDGNQLLVLNHPGHTNELYAIDISTQKRKRYEKLPRGHDLEYATWSPDGTSIVLSSHSKSDTSWSKLYQMTTSGENLKLIIKGGGFAVSWQPIPLKAK